MTDQELKEEFGIPTQIDYINKIKREYDDYVFYTKQINGWLLEIDELNTRINPYKTSPIVIPSGTVEHDPHKHSPLEDEREYLEKLIEMNVKKMKPIDDFLKTLTEEEYFLIKHTYFTKDPWTYEKLSDHLHMGLNTAKRIVDYVCLNYWYSAHGKK